VRKGNKISRQKSRLES